MICKKTFNLVIHLQAHVKRVHNKIKNHICQICEARFASTADLNDHIKRQHEKVKEFKCNSCQYASVTSCDLERHIKPKHNHNKTNHEEMNDNIMMKGHINIKCKSDHQDN